MSTYSYFNFCIFIFVGHEVPGVVAALFSKVAGSKYTCKRLRVYEATKSVWTALSQEVIFECWNALKRKRVSNVFVNSCNSALEGCHVIWIKAIYLSTYLSIYLSRCTNSCWVTRQFYGNLENYTEGHFKDKASLSTIYTNGFEIFCLSVSFSVN